MRARALAAHTGRAQFEDVQRALAAYVRGLVHASVSLFPAPAGVARAFASAHGWFFPRSYPMYDEPMGRAAYFAAAAHLAAHARFGTPRFRRGTLRPIAVVLVSLLEDARVERCMVRELPGLQRLFLGFHTARPSDHPSFPALCARIARALLDRDYADPHPLVERARAWFWAVDGAPSVEACRQLGSVLGNEVGQLRLPFNAKEYAVEPPYRDDHRLLWEEPPEPDQPPHTLEADTVERARSGPRPPRESTGAERGQGVRRRPSATQTDRADAPDAGIAASEERRAHYPEFDYQIQCVRPRFCTVVEQRVQALGGGRAGGDVLEGASAVRVRALARRLRLEALARRRREHEGDALELDAAVEAQLARKVGAQPDPRVFVHVRRQRRSVALLVLLDLSASTGERPRGSGRPVLELARDGCRLLGSLLVRTGDRFAIHGFSSDGRHRVLYRRLKDLTDPWDATAEARLAAVTPQLSTRMGAAIRHATESLRGVSEEHKLILLLTDGEPADIDAHDPAYLLHDARHAVQSARRRGVQVFALSLDAQADRYVQRIFGAGGYLVLERAEALPGVLARLYARLAR